MTLGMKWKSPNLVVGYHLSNTTDFGPTAYTLSNNASTAFPFDGFGGGCAYFSGTSNYLYNLGGAPVDTSTTTSVWVKFVTVADGATYAIFIHAKLSGSYEYTKVYLTRSGTTYTVWVQGSTTGTTLTYAIPNFALETWYHLVITRNSADSAMILYFNGCQVSTGTGGTTNANSTQIVLGFLGTETKLLGKLDEFVVYNTVLSPGDVRRLYAEGKGMLV